MIDENRIYLMGHSMEAIGTWKIAPKYPDIWAAIAPISGTGAPATLERIRTVPEVVVHGDNDPTVSVNGSRTMVAKLKELGTEHRYIEVRADCTVTSSRRTSRRFWISSTPTGRRRACRSRGGRMCPPW